MPLDPIPALICPWNAGFANPGEPSAAEAPSPATPAAGRSPFRPEPLDPESTRTIWTWADPIWTARSRSSGRYLRIPVRPGLIAKEPLHFLLFNPHSQSVQKYFLFSPKFDAQPPELSKYRTRRPSLVISRVRPQNYPLFMFRPSVFAQNPLELQFSYN